MITIAMIMMKIKKITTPIVVAESEEPTGFCPELVAPPDESITTLLL